METAILWPLVLLTVSSFSVVVTTAVTTTGPQSENLPSDQNQPSDNGLGTVVAHLIQEQIAMAAKQQVPELSLAATQEELDATKTKLEVAETKLGLAETKHEATETDLNATKTKLQTTTSELQAFKAVMKIGSSFVRWGRKTCPKNTVRVYEGIAGGKSFERHGGGTNPLCLTKTPQFDGMSKPSYHAYLYGAEYDHIPYHHDQDVPCSVCLAPQSTTIMVPATLTCPSGWTPQYTGHLSSMRDGIHASQYVCLDEDPENSFNSGEDYQGLLFHFVVTVCGSLPCPPYINDRVVTCVVCSK